MHLTPRETEKLMLHFAGKLAQARLEKGLKLNYPESIAYISMQLLELAREGKTVAELMQQGKQMLSADNVIDGVAEMIKEIQVEATFPDGTKLVTVHSPIPSTGKIIPGEIITKDGFIYLNKDKETVDIDVTNKADRPVQVGSHFHFFEVNKKLDFNRTLAYGMRLDIPSGTAVRFEPGETKTVRLVKIGGARIGLGLNGLVNGNIDNAETKKAALAKAKSNEFMGVSDV